MRFLTGIDLGQNELKSGVLENIPNASLPSGVAGQVAFDSTNNEIVFHDGSSWSAIHSGGGFVTSVTSGNSGITIGGTSTAPTVSHADTSSAANLTASSRTYVSALTFDDYGHVTGYSTGSESVVNTTYSVTVPSSTTTIRLTGSDASTSDVTLSASGGATVTRTSATEITIGATNTTYTAGNGISLSSTTFSVAAGTGLTQNASGLALSHLGIQSLIDPNADRILFWDDSAGATGWLTAGTNLTISGTSMSSTDTNHFVTGASFSGGTLTLTGSGSAGASVSLDGRYLQSETQTLDDVTTLGSTTTNAITVGGLTVNGNLTVSGAVTSKVSETLLVEDALFVLNSNETGAPTQDAGFVIERGSSTNQMFVWDESADEFIVASTTETGSTAGNAVVSAYAAFHAGAIKAGGTLNLGTVVNAGVDTNKFLVLDASGNVDFRTGTELLSDIGGQASGSFMTSFNTAGNTGTGSITNGETLTVNGTGLVSVALSGDTFTVSTTANNYAHPTQTAISENNSGFTFLQDIQVNTLGHVTSVATGTVTAATASATGVVELATTTEAATGTDTTRAVTAAGVTAAIKGREAVATIGDGTSTSIAVTHSLGTRDVIVQLYDVSTFDTVYADVTRNTTNQVTIEFGSAPAASDIRVLIKAIEI